jgi:hypothetical protein
MDASYATRVWTFCPFRAERAKHSVWNGTASEKAPALAAETAVSAARAPVR